MADGASATQLTLMGGFSYDEYTASGITVNNAPTFAGSLVYDPVNFGRSRPFVEIGGGATPYEQVHYTRSYPNGDGPASATATESTAPRPVRAGRLGRASRRSTKRRSTGTSAETGCSRRLYRGATGQSLSRDRRKGLDTLNVARLGGQYTHLFNGQFEANVSGAVAYGSAPDRAHW